MIARIARKELTEMLRDGRFRWTAAIVGLLLAGAFATGLTQYRRVAAERAAAERAARAHWLGQAPKNAHSAAHYGVYAFKPASPLALVDRGVDPYVGVFAWLEAHKQNDFRYRPAQDATALERMGAWTAATVMQLLVPLVIIVLAFPAFAGEREQGTLRQLASLGVDPGALAAGKALGVAGALGALLVPAAALGAAALALSSGSGAPGDRWARAAALFVAYLAYFGAFVAAALAVSARARTARGALVTLLAIWSANALVAPRAAADLARLAHPTPSAIAFNTALERELVGDGDAGRALEDSVKRAHGVGSLDSLPFNFAALALQAGEEHGYRVFDQAYGELAEAFRAQDQLQAALGTVAPLLAVRALSMALAGTDREHHLRFAADAEGYRRRMVETMNGALLRVDARADAFATRGDSTLWRRVPPFVHDAPTTTQVLASQGVSLLALALWAIVAAVAATLAARGLARGLVGGAA